MRDERRSDVIKEASQKRSSTKGISGAWRHDDHRAKKGKSIVMPPRMNRHDSVRSVLSEIPLDGSIIEGKGKLPR